MKTLLTFFVLLSSSFVFAEDISDFEIEGMSIGDSLLDFYTKTEIKNARKSIYPKSNTYYEVWLLSKSVLYEEFAIGIKENDKTYKIESLNGVKFFENNLKECLKFKNNVVNDLKKLFPNIKKNDYEYKYDHVDDGKSIAYITDFNLSDGAVRIFCLNWSVVTEKERGWKDSLEVSLSTNIFLDWITNDAQ